MMLLFLIPLIAGLLLLPLSLVLTGAGAVLVVGGLTGFWDRAVLGIGLPLLSVAVLGRPLAVRLLLWGAGDDEYPALRPARAGCCCGDRPCGPAETLEIVSSGGVRLHVERAGEAGWPMLLLTPGLGQSTKVWDDVWPLVHEGYQVVTWDLPGLGRSAPRPDGDYSLTALAGDLRSVLESQADRIGPGGVVLIGQSLSAMVMLEFCRLSLSEVPARERLQRWVAGLVLVDGTDSPPLTTMAHGEFWRRLRRPLIEPALRAIISLAPLLNPLLRLCYHNGSFIVLVRGVAFAGRQSPGALDRLARILSHNPLQTTARIACQCLDFDATHLLPRIPVPVLLVHGARDFVCTRATVERMARCLPHARLEIWEPGRHVSCLEYPARFRRLLGEGVQVFGCSGVQGSRAGERVGD